MKPVRPDPIAMLTGRLRSNARPEAIGPAGMGGKFSLDGTVERFPGNTIICHIARDSSAFRELVGIQKVLKAGPYARHFTFLPPDSFHMTVFPGVTELVRDTKRWPNDIPRDAPMADVTAELAKRLAPVHAPLAHTIKVDGLFAGYSVTVSGADAEQETSLRDLRDRAREATGIHDPDHDAYVFHITLAYQVEWVDEATARSIVEMSDRLGTELAANVPRIQLGQPEVCTFDSMHRFDPIGLLGSEGLVPFQDGRPRQAV